MHELIRPGHKAVVNDYWMGVLTLPALAVSCLLAYLVFHLVTNIVGRLSNAAIKLGPSLSAPKREHLAAATYAAKRGWVFAAGDTGIAIFAGLDPDEQKKASDALRPHRPTLAHQRPRPHRAERSRRRRGAPVMTTDQTCNDRRRKASDLVYAAYKTGPTTQLNHEALTDLVSDLLGQVEITETNTSHATTGDRVRVEWNALMSTGQLHFPNSTMPETYARECAARAGWSLVTRNYIHRPSITTPWRDA